jgi:hypothetical protein
VLAQLLAQHVHLRLRLITFDARIFAATKRGQCQDRADYEKKHGSHRSSPRKSWVQEGLAAPGIGQQPIDLSLGPPTDDALRNYSSKTPRSVEL